MSHVSDKQLLCLWLLNDFAALFLSGPFCAAESLFLQISSFQSPNVQTGLLWELNSIDNITFLKKGFKKKSNKRQM